MSYPRMLYKDSKENHIIVNSEYEEAAARKNGWTSHWFYKDEVKPKRRRAKRRKV